MTACVRKAYGSVKNIIHLGQKPPSFWGPRLQPAKPIGKSDTVNNLSIKWYWSHIEEPGKHPRELPKEPIEELPRDAPPMVSFSKHPRELWKVPIEEFPRETLP